MSKDKLELKVLIEKKNVKSMFAIVLNNIHCVEQRAKQLVKEAQEAKKD